MVVLVEVKDLLETTTGKMLERVTKPITIVPLYKGDIVLVLIGVGLMVEMDMNQVAIPTEVVVVEPWDVEVLFIRIIIQMIELVVLVDCQ